MAELKTISIGNFTAQNSNYVAGTGITITADAQDATIKTIAADLANYYTKSETYSQQEVNDLIGALESITMQVVQQLPATGESNVIYLVPKTGGGYTEHVWIEADSDYEEIGDTDIDLSNYYTKTETDNLLDGKQDTLTAGQNISIAQDGTISATYNTATTSTDGLMSAADKTKLDGITWTKAGILSALGYEEVTLELTDANGNSVTKTILAAV